MNPCSGCYEGGDANTDVQIIVDVDRTAKYTKSLDMVSGTISGKNSGHAPWYEYEYCHVQQILTVEQSSGL